MSSSGDGDDDGGRIHSKGTRKREDSGSGSQDDDVDPDEEQATFEETGADPEEETESRASDSAESERAEDVADEVAEDTIESSDDGAGGAGGAGGAAASGASGGAADGDTGETASAGDDGGQDDVVAGGTSPEEIAEFAQQTFAEGAIDPRYRDSPPEDVPAFPPEEPSHENRVGTWDGFSEDRIESIDEIHANAYTADAMRELTLDTDSGAGAGTAFATNYNRDTALMEDPPPQFVFDRVGNSLKQSQLALNAFTETIGLKGPDMTYNTEREYVVSKAVADDIKTLDDESVNDDDRLEKVDRDELVDMMATHLASGNWDVAGRNIGIDADGGVHIYDYDRMDNDWIESDGITQHGSGHAIDSVEEIAEHRDDNALDGLTEEDITKRSEEIAYLMEESGQKTVASEAVRSHLKEAGVPESQAKEYADRVRLNIQSLAARHRADY